MFATVSIKKNSCPIGYKNKDSVISNPAARTATGACTESGPSIWFFQDHCWKQRYNPNFKPQASSVKHQAPIFRKLQAASVKLSNQPVQSPSDKHPIPNNKRQASSVKHHAPIFRKLSNQPVQASGDKRQAPGSKRQAPSHKRQAP